MKLFCFIALVVIAVTGCATPSYVLHTRPPSKWYYLFWQPKENSRTEDQAGVALIADRRPFVEIEHVQPNGNAWVHYRVEVKNDSGKPISIGERGIKLQTSKEEIPATLLKADLSLLKGSLADHSQLQIDARFEIPASKVEDFSGSKAPLSLIVSYLKDGQAQQVQKDLWLWQE